VGAGSGKPKGRRHFLAPRDRKVAEKWGLTVKRDLTPSSKTIRRNPGYWLIGLKPMKEMYRNTWKPGAEIECTREEFENYLDLDSEERAIVCIDCLGNPEALKGLARGPKGSKFGCCFKLSKKGGLSASAIGKHEDALHGSHGDRGCSRCGRP